MASKSNRILRPDLSLRDNIELSKLLERAAKKRAQQHLTRVGLNTANVFNADVTRNKVPASQRREDYVRVPEWSTRAVMEQLPSITRLEREAADVRKLWLSGKNISRRVFSNLDSTRERDKQQREQNKARLELILALEKHGLRDTPRELRAEWFPGSF